MPAALVLLGGGTAYAAYRYDHAASSRLLPGIRIDGVDVGGMTRDEAIRAVEESAGALLRSDLEVRAAGSTWTVTPEDLGTKAEVQGAVEEAFSVADSMSFFSRVYHRLSDDPVPTSIELRFTYDRGAIERFVKRASEEVFKPAVDASITLVDGQLVMRRSRAGRALDARAAAARIHSALVQRSTSVTIPVETVRPKVTAATLGRTIVVDLSENRLYLYDGFKVMREYPVATAAPGYTTPVGVWKVVNKVENPAWYNPAPDGWGAGEPLEIPPGPGNPLGTRALYLSAPGIRIHGTYNSSSIGTYASHGCIRMYISDSEELYPLVPIGTPVIIEP
jgi:lipoprotein-anchoring transpeptidase ErfK/SrfK